MGLKMERLPASVLRADALGDFARDSPDRTLAPTVLSPGFVAL